LLTPPAASGGNGAQEKTLYDPRTENLIKSKQRRDVHTHILQHPANVAAEQHLAKAANTPCCCVLRMPLEVANQGSASTRKLNKMVDSGCCFM